MHKDSAVSNDTLLGSQNQTASSPADTVGAKADLQLSWFNFFCLDSHEYTFKGIALAKSIS